MNVVDLMQWKDYEIREHPISNQASYFKFANKPG